MEKYQEVSIIKYNWTPEDNDYIFKDIENVIFHLLMNPKFTRKELYNCLNDKFCSLEKYINFFNTFLKDQNYSKSLLVLKIKDIKNSNNYFRELFEFYSKNIDVKK